MQAADHGDDDPLESDVAFHVAVLRATRNRFYLQLIGLTSTALRFSIQTTNRYKGVQQASVAAHRKVMDGILAGKPVAAAEAMRKISTNLEIPVYIAGCTRTSSYMPTKTHPEPRSCWER